MPDPAALLADAHATLARLPALLDGLTGGLDDAGWRARPAPAEWAPIEIVCHLRDEEAEDFVARLRVALAGGPAFAPIDPEGWAVSRRYREDDPARALSTLRQRREANLAFLATVAPGDLHRAVPDPRLGSLSGEDLLAAWAAHDGLHLAQLAATLARLWADRWAPLRVGYAGPIPYPRA